MCMLPGSLSYSLYEHGNEGRKWQERFDLKIFGNETGITLKALVVKDRHSKQLSFSHATLSLIWLTLSKNLSQGRSCMNA